MQVWPVRIRSKRQRSSPAFHVPPPRLQQSAVEWSSDAGVLEIKLNE
ncbi:MAG: hypothetical protein WD049_01410 [Candidatus Paceibacterota bacterium]